MPPTTPSLTEPGVMTIYLRGEDGYKVRVERTARLANLDIPTGVGDKQQFLGSKSRRIILERGVVYYPNNRAGELDAIATIARWIKDGTMLDYYSPTVPDGMTVRLLRAPSDEEASPTGIRYELEAIETSSTPQGPAPSNTVPLLPQGDVIPARMESVIITNS